MKLTRKITFAAVPVILALGAAASRHGTGACVTDAMQGSCPYGSGVYRSLAGQAVVTQGVWNPAASQTLTANSVASWTVTAKAASPDPVSYPSTQVTYTLANGRPEPLADFGSTLAAAWSVTSPAGAKRWWTWGFKLWLGDPALDSWSGDQEIQVWTWPHGTIPPGRDTRTRYTSADGEGWEVWAVPGHPTVSAKAEIITLVRDHNAPAGSLDLMGLMQWLVTAGWTADGFGIDQVSYGVEVTTTGGSAATWTLANYALTDATTAPAATTQS